eukprot:TRINITY_DN1688_c2_g1_i2.p1 TRINITY_DN1688_c2_g1~~TRINITY_DN1688_c2_g1_i2.p1  ORF type:complete len:351 (-),score=120.01 TRINITY_DN1688_c2_g1_i2:60-1112(-)
MQSFHKYYSGEQIAPILTIFIGGNHEASNHLWELYYGGWVCENIYYLGASGVVNFGGLRIAGISGIFKDYDYLKGHYEKPPFNNKDIRTIYHMREFEIFKLLQFKSPIDIFISHDWPQGITKFGNETELLRKKNFLRTEIANNSFGNPATRELLMQLQPCYWFSAHMHVKFQAIVSHKESGKQTKFLALDKCLPGRDFLQIIDLPSSDSSADLKYDIEWLAILKKTNEHLRFDMNNISLLNSNILCIPSLDDIKYIENRFDNSYVIPKNFINKRDSNELDNLQRIQLLAKLELPNLFVKQNFNERIIEIKENSKIEQNKQEEIVQNNNNRNDKNEDIVNEINPDEIQLDL